MIMDIEIIKHWDRDNNSIEKEYVTRAGDVFSNKRVKPQYICFKKKDLSIIPARGIQIHNVTKGFTYYNMIKP